MVRAKRRSGIDPLAYMGDEPNTPFQGTVQLRSPNENDYANWNIGTFWINQNFSDPLNNEIWMLVSKINNVATWIMVGAGGSTGIDFPTDAGTATPAGGLLNIFGGINISTAGAGNAVTVNFDGILPVSSGGTGVATLTDGGVLVGSGTNPVTVTAVGTNGQVLIGATGADPAFATLTSADSTIDFFAGANSLDLFTGSSVPVSFTTDSGSAVPAVGILNILGGVGVTTSGAGDTVTIDTTSSILTTGSFTPVLTFGGSSVGISYLRQEGAFAKIGTICFVFLTIELSSKGSSTGQCSITGLPFTSTGSLEDMDLFTTALNAITYPGTTENLHGAISGGTTFLNFNATGSNQFLTNLNDTNLANDSLFKMQGFYFTV